MKLGPLAGVSQYRKPYRHSDSYTLVEEDYSGSSAVFLVRCNNCNRLRKGGNAVLSRHKCVCHIAENQWKGHGEISGRLWSSYKVTARKRNRVFTLAIEYAWELFVNQNRLCRFSNIPLIFGTTEANKTSTTASLDRIDSSIGYIEGNVQWVHKTVNMMKQRLTDAEFIYWCTLIANNAKALS